MSYKIVHKKNPHALYACGFYTRESAERRYEAAKSVRRQGVEENEYHFELIEVLDQECIEPQEPDDLDDLTEETK